MRSWLSCRPYLIRSVVALWPLLGALNVNPLVNGQVEDPDQPFVITAQPSVDENLFALRLLADIYSHWPDLKGDRSNLKKWFAEARRSIATMQREIRSRRLDPDLDTLFQDCLDYMSATESYLSRLDLIENQNNTRTAWDVIASIWDAYKAASDATSMAEKFGFSDEHAASAGKIVGAANAAATLYAKSQSRDENYSLAISEEARKLENKWNSTWGTLQVVARRMTTKNGWRPGEAGFDGFQSPDFADLIARYPRDPFIKARLGDMKLRSAQAANDCIVATNAYLEAAQLVPADNTYDSLRLQYLAQAAEAAVAAPALQAGSRGYVSRPSAAPSALKVARTYLAMDPSDVTGTGRVQLARALAFSGRFEEAAAAATAAYKQHSELRTDAYFCYRYAKLMSLTSNFDLVGSWIEQAYRDGFHDIGSFRSDPDLETFRSQRSQLFKNLTTVNWTWNVKYGMILDDIVVRNNSPFDLTNVQVQVHIRKGSSTWDPLVKCPLIKAGSSCREDNVMIIPGDSYDTGTASLATDQS